MLFFGWMFVMICFEITLGKTGFIPMQYLSLFCLILGIPLLLSTFRFYFYGFNVENAKKIKRKDLYLFS